MKYLLTGPRKGAFFIGGTATIEIEIEVAGTRPGRRLTFCKPTKSKQKAASLPGALLEGQSSSGNVERECRPQVSATVATCDRFPGRRQKYSSCEGGLHLLLV
jgi:hypothetical protein